jgi:hypothetical protein
MCHFNFGCTTAVQASRNALDQPPGKMTIIVIDDHER